VLPPLLFIQVGGVFIFRKRKFVVQAIKLINAMEKKERNY
jgi:hypothetical protein